MEGAEIAESALNDAFDGDLEDFETLPCSWTYVIVCIVLPFLTGQINVLPTPGYTLHFEEMGWPLTSAGAAFSAGFGLRIIMQQVVLRAGYWIAVPLCMVHLTIVILALIYTTSEWAVCAQLVVVWGIDPACAIEGIAFDCFGASEAQARQASSTSLSMSTISIAVSCTIGGLIYDATGWTGVTAYHCALEGLLVLLLSLQPACRKSFMEVFFPKKDPEVEAAEDQTETSGEMVFKQVVPGQAQAVQLPGATEELHLEEVEDENAKKASSMRRRQVSKENDQDDQSPGQEEWEIGLAVLWCYALWPAMKWHSNPPCIAPYKVDILCVYKVGFRSPLYTLTRIKPCFVQKTCPWTWQDDFMQRWFLMVFQFTVYPLISHKEMTQYMRQCTL
jgi:hypothetical protein